MGVLHKLFVCHHGEADQGGNLTQEGRWQMRKLGVQIKPFTQARSVRLISSTAECAKQSAAILIEMLGLKDPPVTFDLLFPINEMSSNALVLVRALAQDVEVLIVVTHIQVTANLPNKFAEQELGTSVEAHSVETGKAVVIDCRYKTSRLIG